MSKKKNYICHSFSYNHEEIERVLVVCAFKYGSKSAKFYTTKTYPNKKRNYDQAVEWITKCVHQRGMDLSFI